MFNSFVALFFFPVGLFLLYYFNYCQDPYFPFQKNKICKVRVSDEALLENTWAAKELDLANLCKRDQVLVDDKTLIDFGTMRSFESFSFKNPFKLLLALNFFPSNAVALKPEEIEILRPNFQTRSLSLKWQRDVGFIFKMVLENGEPETITIQRDFDPSKKHFIKISWDGVFHHLGFSIDGDESQYFKRKIKFDSMPEIAESKAEIRDSKNSSVKLHELDISELSYGFLQGRSLWDFLMATILIYFVGFFYQKMPHMDGEAREG